MITIIITETELHKIEEEVREKIKSMFPNKKTYFELYLTGDFDGAYNTMTNIVAKTHSFSLNREWLDFKIKPTKEALRIYKSHKNFSTIFYENKKTFYEIKKGYTCSTWIWVPTTGEMNGKLFIRMQTYPRCTDEFFFEGNLKNLAKVAIKKYNGKFLKEVKQ